ncbi:MAG: methionine biosynthesis protein MetW [Actinomycetes bacterium]
MRLDLGVIADMVPPGSRVLDLGCGDGALLEELIRHRGCQGQGVEVSSEAFHACVARGIPVVAADIDEGLPDFTDGSFDVVVLSLTLQATRRPSLVLREMMRVADTGIVSFINYGHMSLRLQLLLHGRMPIPHWVAERWFETANIHPCSIRDFEALARAEGLETGAPVVLAADGSPAAGLAVRRPNAFARAAAYVVRRAPTGGVR